MAKQVKAKQGIGGWSMAINREADKGQLNTQVSRDILDDLNLLRSHYGATQGEIVEKCLRMALDANVDLDQLKAAQKVKPSDDQKPKTTDETKPKSAATA